MNHFIGKQVLELNRVSRSEAFQWQHRLSQEYWQRISPALEALFDRLAPEDEYIVIEHLTLDLGEIPRQELTSGKWIQNLITQLTTTLEQEIVKLRSAPKSIDRPTGTFGRWLNELQYGLPSFYSGNPEPEAHRKILDTLGLQVYAAQRLKEILSTTPQARERLVYQHDTDFLISIMELFSAQPQKELKKALHEIQSAWKQQFSSTLSPAEEAIVWKLLQLLPEGPGHSPYKPGILKKSLPRWKHRSEREMTVQFWTYLLELLFQKNLKTSATGYLKLWAREVPVVRNWLNQYAQIENETLSANSSLTPLIQEVANLPPQTPLSTASHQENLPPIFNPEEHRDTQIERKHLLHQARILELEKEGIYVPTAGLVLAYPYLLRFLKNRELVEEKAFPDTWHQHKAAILLHYFATGSTQPQARALSLAKLLCGIPLGIPIDTRLSLDEEDQVEAEELLEVIVEHWGALGKTSADGLREGFLMRTGKLSRKSNGWLLQVERKTMDILLDRLPWGFNVIRFPWMEHMLFVEWN